MEKDIRIKLLLYFIIYICRVTENTNIRQYKVNSPQNPKFSESLWYDLILHYNDSFYFLNSI